MSYSRTVTSAPPPFYWKVPVPEKDYMSENYRRIRQIANQTQKKRNGPLKAAFVPGVTKNEKYAHVTSRVGEFLKVKKSQDAAIDQRLDDPQRLPQRNSSGINQPVARRLSKSSVDLRPTKAAGSHSAPNAISVPRNQLNTSLSTRRRRGSEESFNPQQESVYNWRFKDDVVEPSCFSNGFSTGASSKNVDSSSLSAKYCHRVEYLPCDGICAEENFVVGDELDSARSASSCRTSRGCNTEETRILEDPSRCFSQISKPDNNEVYQVAGNESDAIVPVSTDLPKSRSAFTLSSQPTNNSSRKNESFEWFGGTNSPVGNTNDLGRRFNSMKISSTPKFDSSRVRTSLSSTNIREPKQSQVNGVGGSGDFRHTLGTVPKYLKQRQDEWKTQEKEKKEAELNANVPRGYVLLSDDERNEHLRTFKQNYDSLINELNRIPIRIDTIRVKEHKIQLEHQLTRLEEAMKTFSRPRVWVKVDV